MLHKMLKYLEVYTDLNLITIPTIPLEICAGIDIDRLKLDEETDVVQDGAQVRILSNYILQIL